MQTFYMSDVDYKGSWVRVSLTSCEIWTDSLSWQGLNAIGLKFNLFLQRGEESIYEGG